MCVCIYMYTVFAKAIFVSLQSVHISLHLDIRFYYWFGELGNPGLYKSGRRTVNLQPSDSMCISSECGYFNTSCCQNATHLYLTWMFSLHSVLPALLGLALWDHSVFWAKAWSFISSEWFHSGEGKKAINKMSVWNCTLELPKGKVSWILQLFLWRQKSRNSLSLMEVHRVNTSPKAM